MRKQKNITIHFFRTSKTTMDELIQMQQRGQNEGYSLSRLIDTQRPEM
jgi:hypothetical protein